MPAHRLLLFCLIAALLPAAAAMRDGQIPGWFRFAAGTAMVTAAEDGTADLPVAGFKGIEASEIEALSARAFSRRPGTVPVSFNAFVIDTGKRRILIDGGNEQCYGFPLGGLVGNLKAAGYAPKDIDLILITHLHGDHICGLVHGGKRVFPKAAVWAAAADAAYWLDAANKGTPQGVRDAVALYGKDFHTFKPGETIAPEITILPAPGHTPGHTAYLLQGKDGAVLFFGDIVHNAYVQFAHPEVTVRSDIDPALAVQSRKSLFEKAAAENMVIAGSHLPFPGIGRLRRDGSGYIFVPAEWKARP